MTVTSNELKIFSGRSNVQLAQRITEYLEIPLGEISIRNFADGELWVKYEENIRGKDVFIIQSTGPSINNSPNDNMIELMIFIDALKRGSARSVNAVIPYYGYQRQDRKDYSRAPISARVMATCLEALGVDRVIVFDLHAGQIQGFFSSVTPVDNLYVESYFIKYIKKNILGVSIPLTDSLSISDLVIVSPDEGGMKRAVRVSNKLKCSAATIYKDRSKPNEINKMVLMGNVSGKVAVIVDDIIDTAGTACKAAEILHNNGATEIYILTCHGVLSGPAVERITNSHFKKVVITNTLEASPEVVSNPKIDILDVSWYCAEAMQRSIVGKSLKELYDNPNTICAV